MSYTLAYKRHKDYIKAVRKRDIDRYHQHNWATWQQDWYDNLHQYSKNKIHCSCGMCSRYNKTNNKGRRRLIHGNYAPSRNWSHQDQKTMQGIEDRLNEVRYERTFIDCLIDYELNDSAIWVAL